MKKIFLPLSVFVLFLLCSCSGIGNEQLLLNHPSLTTKSILPSSLYESNIVQYAGHPYIETSAPFRIDDASIALGIDSLAPTHRAIRILPKDIKQIHSLEEDTALTIFYHPFGYQPLPESFNPATEALTPATIIEDCGEFVLDDNTTTFDIFPLYVLWPISYPIPNDIDYTFEYYAYVPKVAELASLNIESSSNNNRSSIMHGCLTVFDNRLGTYVPLSHARIHYQVSSIFSLTAITNSNGLFTMYYPKVDGFVSIELANTKFSIRDGNTSNVASLFLSQLSTFITENNYINIQLPTSFVTDVFKAASYYFYGSNDVLDGVTKYDATNNTIDIHAINADGAYLGCFYSYSESSTNEPYIDIWNPYVSNYSGASSKVFGTVLHELGHASHFATIGHSQMQSCQIAIKESFSSFFGWFNVKEYYSSIIVSHATVNDICTQGRQYWYPTTTNNFNYTPIFIDLYDNYNQHYLLGSTYNDDPISSFPTSSIIQLAMGLSTMNNLYYTLYNYTGINYTVSEYNTFIQPYNVFVQ